MLDYKPNTCSKTAGDQKCRQGLLQNLKVPSSGLPGKFCPHFPFPQFVLQVLLGRLMCKTDDMITIHLKATDLALKGLIRLPTGTSDRLSCTKSRATVFCYVRSCKFADMCQTIYHIPQHSYPQSRSPQNFKTTHR